MDLESTSVPQPERFARFYFPIQGTRATRGFFTETPAKNDFVEGGINAVGPPLSLTAKRPPEAPAMDRETLSKTGGLPPLPTFRASSDATPTRPNTQQQSDLSATGTSAVVAPTPKLAASQARQSHPPLPFFGHFDVTTPWDFDHPAVDTSAYSPQLGYSRFMLAFVPLSHEDPTAGTDGLKLRPGPADERPPAAALPDGAFSASGALARKFSSLRVGDSVEIKEIAEWAARLYPRGVHDLKPLLILCQGLLRDVLAEKYSFYCEEILLLRDTLRDTQARWKADIEEMQRTIEQLQQSLSEQEVRVGVVEKFKGAMAKMKEAQQVQEKSEYDKKVKEMLAQKEQNRLKLESMYAQAVADLEKNNKTIDQLRQQVEKMTDEAGVADTRMKSPEHQSKTDQRKLQAAQALIKRLQEHLRNKARFMNMAFHDARIEQSLQGLMEGTEDPREIAKWMQRNGVLASAQLLNLLQAEQAYSTVTELPKDFAAGVMSEATVSAVAKMVEFAANSGPAGPDLARALAEIMQDMSPSRVAAVMADLPADVFEEVSEHFAFALEENRKSNKRRVKFFGGEGEDEEDVEVDFKPEGLRRMVTEARDMKVLLRSATQAWEDLEDVMNDEDMGLKEGEELDRDGNAPRVQKALATVNKAAKRAADKMNELDPKVVAEMISDMEGGVADAIMDKMDPQSAAKVIEAIAERAVDTQALKLKQGNDVDKLLAAIERVARSRTHLELTDRLRTVQNLMMHVHGIGFTLRQLVDDSGDPEDIDLETEPAPIDSLKLMLRMDTLSSNEPHVTSIGEAGAADLLRELDGDRPATGEAPAETEEERIAAAMAADVGGDSIQMSESERELARRNMENLAVCLVATLQHEQPVVTRAHMAAPVFIKQDAKEFVFGTLSTSQGSNTMCPLCKRGSETNELTPQAIQHMMLLAKAIGEGVSAVAEAERISVEKVERVLEEAHSVREIPIPDDKDQQAVFKETLQIIALRITQKMRTSEVLRKQLAEIKSYAKPPKQVVQIILCTFLLLGYPGIDRYLTKDLTVPVDTRALWAFLRKGISLEKPSPKYLPPCMSRLAEIITKIPLPDFAYRSSIRALEGISHTEAKQGSHATAMLRKWCLAMINLHRLIHVENI